MASGDLAAAMSAADDAPPRGGSGVGPASRRREISKARLFGLAALLLALGALLWGAWSHYEQRRQAIAEAQKRRDFVPAVRVETVTESESVIHVTWPGTTLAYEQANVYARATGYISTRNVDIGSKVRAGDVLAIIAAPDLDQQLAQARAQLIQMQASVEQAKATAELGQLPARAARSCSLRTRSASSRPITTD